MQNRLKSLRLALGYSQADFAKSLGVKQSTISMIENGKISLSDQIVRAACLAFSVSEDWLRTGEGEMFAAADPEEGALFEALGMLDAPNADPRKKRAAREIVKTIANMPDEVIEPLCDFLRRMLDAMTPPDDPPPGEEKKDEV